MVGKAINGPRRMAKKKWVCERLIFVMHLEDHQLAEVKKNEILVNFL